MEVRLVEGILNSQRSISNRMSQTIRPDPSARHSVNFLVRSNIRHIGDGWGVVFIYAAEKTVPSERKLSQSSKIESYSISD